MCGNIIPHTNHIFQYKYRTINKPFFSKKTYTYTTTKNLIKCKYHPILPAAHNPRGVCIFFNIYDNIIIYFFALLTIFLQFLIFLFCLIYFKYIFVLLFHSCTTMLTFYYIIHILYIGE